MRRDSQLGAVAILDNGTQQRPHRRKSVDQRYLDGLVAAFELLTQRAGSRRVSFANVRGENQNASWPVGVRGGTVVSVAVAQVCPGARGHTTLYWPHHET